MGSAIVGLIHNECRTVMGYEIIVDRKRTRLNTATFESTVVLAFRFKNRTSQKSFFA